MIVAPIFFTAFLALLVPDETDAVTDERPVVTLKLSDGTVLIGRILSEEGGRMRVRTLLLGEIEIDSEVVVDRTEGVAAHEAPSAGLAPPPGVPTAPGAAGPAVTWTRTVGLGGSFVSAPYEQGELDESLPPNVTGKAIGLPGQQLQAQMTFMVMRNSPIDRWLLDASMTYVEAQPAGKLTESTKANLFYTRTIRGRDFLYTSTSYHRDAVRNIDNSFVQVAGVGRRFIDTPTKKFELLPGLLVQRDEKGTIYDGDWLFGYGILESFSFTSSRGIGFEQQLTVRTLVEDADLFTITGYAGVRAPLTKRVALQVGLQFDHDEMLGLQQTVLPGGITIFANKKTALQLTTGLQMSF